MNGIENTEASSLVKRYIESSGQILTIRDGLDKSTEEKNDRICLIHQDYWQKIRQLEQERDEKTRAIENEKRIGEQSAKERIGKLDEDIVKVERILNFLKLGMRKRDIDFDENEIKNYRDRYIEHLGVVYQDEFIKLVALIAENSRPKNKYSLCVVGKSIFSEKDLTFGYCYGLDLNISGNGFDIAVLFRHAPTVEELKRHFSKGILVSQIEHYKGVKAVYLETLNMYKVNDFRGIIKFRCEKCGYFLMEKEINSRRWDGKCPNCSGE
jgi:hypothetical protein